VRIDIRRIAAIKDGDNVIGNRTRAKVVKNKVAPPFRDAEFDILYGKGISFAGDIIDLAVANNIIEKSGTWLSFGGERLGQGREKSRDFIEENKDVMAKIEKQLREKLKTLGKKPVEVAADKKDEKEE
jgi:recombination protein RecA